MKNNLLILTAFLSISLSALAQKDNDDNKGKELISIEPSNETVIDTYNKWSVEIDGGMSKGAKPYHAGYFASDPDSFMGGFQLNHFGLAGRWMLSPKFGLKSHLSYDDLKNISGSESFPFKVQNIQMTFEGVVNAIRLFDIQEQSKRFGLLFHFGMQVSRVSPQMNTSHYDIHNTYIVDGENKGKHELNGGIIMGVTPEVRILNNISLFLDIAISSNIRQHFNWDGSYADRSNNLTGSMFTSALGLSYAFGNEKIHGDWAIIEDNKIKEIKELENRIGEIETLMNDSDKDGVPDYLDVENNSIAGVTVDTKGRMVDKNNNGVPDELEKYVASSIKENNNSTAATDSAIKQLINEGYIAAYFDTNVAIPTNASTDNIGFILNYLRKNKTATIDIIGYADEIGSGDKNNLLSDERAKNVKTILMKAGVDGARLKVIPSGVDNSVDKNSDLARRLVRKVVFKIN